MALGGKILALTHAHLRTQVRPGMSTGQLDGIAEEFIRSHEGATPAFKGLYGFPGAICISVNEEIVHGIPTPKRVLADGDIVKLDVGVQYQGMFTDAAITVPVGTIDATTQRLVDVTERALDAGIAEAIPGNYVGDIGHAVQVVVERAGFSVCASWWGMAWVTCRMRIRRCPTTASRDAARACRRVLPSPLNRW